MGVLYMAKSIINLPFTPIYGTDDTVIATKIKSEYHRETSNSYGFIATGLSAPSVVAVIPFVVENTQTGEVSRDLIIDFRPSDDGIHILLFAHKADGTVWSNVDVAYRLIHLI